ncbi:MAG TPA: hypothetical protein VFU21_08185, partial [Kofleriaceae bacterium]|nr:hypothetical protein [Kofleriaceae bacterium]
MVRRSGAVSARHPVPAVLPAELAPLHLPPEPLAPLHLPPEHLAPLHLPEEHHQAPEFLPSEVFEELLTEIFKRPEDADTEREYSQELPPLPRPRPAAAEVPRRPRATPARPQEPTFRGGPGMSEAPLLEPRPARRGEVAMQRSPRAPANSVATVRPISMPPIDRRRLARSSGRMQQQQQARPVPVEEALRRHPIPRGSAQQPVARSSAQRPAAEPPRPLEAAPPIHAPGFEAVYPRVENTGAPLERPRFPLEHQDEPLAFGGEVLRRAATAVEPAIG